VEGGEGGGGRHRTHTFNSYIVLHVVTFRSFSHN
jgi:hypothetical protein